MQWRMVLEVVGADGERQVHEIGGGGGPPDTHSAATLGLGLEDGKAILAAVCCTASARRRARRSPS
jgi:hypothetical protein